MPFLTKALREHLPFVPHTQLKTGWKKKELHGDKISYRQSPAHNTFNALQKLVRIITAPVHIVKLSARSKIGINIGFVELFKNMFAEIECANPSVFHFLEPLSGITVVRW